MDKEILFSVLSDTLPVFVAALGTLLATKQLFSIKRTKKGDKENIFNSIDEKFSSRLIRDRSDIEVIINSYSRSNDELYSIAPVLEDYFTKRLSKTDKIDENEIDRRYDLLKEIIKEENKDKPFSDVPDEERRLLISMKDALGNKDNQAIEFNINELNSVLTTRNKMYEKVNRLNKWSVPLAIIGTFFTILFGILSLSPQKIDYEKVKNDNQIIIQNELKKLKEEPKTFPNTK